MYVEYGFLTGQIFAVVFGGEGYVYIHIRADFRADQLIFKAGDEAAAAQNQFLIIGGAAGELFFAHEARVIDVHLIIQLGGTAFDLYPAGGAVARALDFGLDIVLGHFVNGLYNAQILVCAQFNVGTNEHFYGELQFLAAADFLNVQFGTIHDLNVVLLQPRLIDFGEDRVESFLIEYFGAVMRLDYLHRRLASAEAGDVDLLHHLQVCLLDAFLKLFGFHGEAQLYLVGRQLFKRSGHGMIPPAISINKFSLNKFSTIHTIFQRSKVKAG